MERRKRKTLIFKPWNVLVILGVFGIIIIITKYNVTIPDAPTQVYYTGGIVIGLLGTAYFVRNVIRYLKTYGWATTHATIIASQIDTIDDSEGVLYEPHISYTYHVGTRDYSSSRIYPSGTWRSSFPSVASKPVTRYPVGKTAQIYYNPSRPDQSFLIRKGLLFILVGLLAFTIMIVAFSLALVGIIHI